MAGFSVPETARVLRVSENSVKTQVRKGLARLREELTDDAS
jgi:DNA-directed RNA polymerase specialized sigma24 family protein